MKKFSFLSFLGLLYLLMACTALAGENDAVHPTSEPLASPFPTLPLPTLTPAPPPPRVLRIGMGAYPDVFDPQKSSFSAEISILQLAYEGLTRLDEKGNVIPGAAERWESSADGKQMTFHLRAGMKRADGQPLQCYDFKYALKREVDPTVPGKQYTSLVYDIQGAVELDALAADDPSSMDYAKMEELFTHYGVRCQDPQTLVITFRRAVNDGAFLASLMVAFPTDERVVRVDPDTWWTHAENHNGNGMFRVAKIEDGKKIVFKANPNYWGGRPKLDRIEFIFNDDPNALLDQYQRGELEILSLDAAQLAIVQANPSLAAQLVRYPAASISGITFNQRVPPFNDRNVRVAFSQMLDREGWVRVVNSGIGIPYTRWIPPGIPGAQSNVPGVPSTNFEAAVRTLTDNGYAAADSTAEHPKVDCAKLGEIKITYPQSTLNDIRFKFLVNNFQSVFNCPLVLDPVDISVPGGPLIKDPVTFPLISRQGWIQDYPHPKNWLSIYWTCNGFAARSGYCNPALDSLLARADATPNLAAALPLYHTAETLLLSDVPDAIINYGEHVFLVAPYVVGPPSHKSTNDLTWIGQYGPVLDYDIDTTRVPVGYPNH